MFSIRRARLVQFMQLLAMIMYSVAWVRWGGGGAGDGRGGLLSCLLDMRSV